MRLHSCHRSKGRFRAAEWLIKKSLSKVYILLRCFNCHFDKQANIRCSTGNISRSISSRDRNATDQAIATGDTKVILETLPFLFLEKKTRCRKNWPKDLYSYLQFFHRGKDFQSSYITFDIFNNSTFFCTTQETNESYKFW